MSGLLVLGHEEIDAWLVGQIRRPAALGASLRGHPPGELLQVLDAVDAEIPHPLDETVQHIHRRPRVDQGSVIWRNHGVKVPGERRQPAIRHFVPQQYLACKRRRVDHRPAWWGVSQLIARPPQESHVKGRVVGDDHRALRERQKARQHSRQDGCVSHHRIRDAGQHRDQRRDVGPGIDEGLELALHHPSAHLDGPELGDRIRLGASGGFQIDDAERHLGQVRTKIIE